MAQLDVKENFILKIKLPKITCLIVDHRGVVVNGKLKEYYRNVEKTGIADTEYEQESKDGYRYCDDHDDYDDCHYGRDD